MPSHPAIAIDRVTVCYDGADVLRDVSLDIAPGESIVLSGPSGSGKSTLLKCVLGFARPQSGAVRVQGDPLTPQSVWRLRRAMTWVAQEPDLGDGTAREAIERPFAYRANEDRRDRLDRAPALFEALGLAPSLLDKEVADLSGGEKQRVGLVAALLLERPILLLDEPTSALDAESRDRVVAHLGGLQDTTILAVAHDAENHAYASRKVDLAALKGGAPA